MANVFVQKISTPGDVEISVCFPKTIKRIRSASINDKLTDRKTLDKMRLEHGMRLPGGDYEIVVRY